MHTTYKIWRFIKTNIYDLLLFVKKIFISIAGKAWNKFLDINFAEKIIYLNIILAFFAVVLPVARFEIFGGYFPINNPLGVYLIGVVAVMVSAAYFRGLKRLIPRLLVNAYYLFWIIYIPLTEGLTKAKPHQITYWYYLDIAVPVIFIAASVLSYFLRRE